jgi:MurNAc alpha-1-phosphate uridylyltransferase
VSKEANKYFSKAFSGIHVISPAIFPLIKMEGKFSMVDVYLQLCKTHTITGFDHSTTKFIDVGRPENIVIAEEIFS